MYKKRSHAESESTNSDDPNMKGKAGSAADEAQQPKRRSLPSKSLTIPFFQRTWEEIPPGKMFYLPTCISPKYMFDDIMVNQFNAHKNLWGTMTISKPKVRISNIIMLQDDLRVQNNTPTDATAFTQVCYLMHFVPENQKQFFKFLNVSDFSDYTGEDLTYTLEPNISHTQLVELHNFSLFESLGLAIPTVSESAGYDPGKSVTFVAEQTIADPYLSPRNKFPFGMLAGNMSPSNFIGQSLWVPNMYQILMTRNMNGLSFHKYGDEIEFEIETNLDGVHLLNKDYNDFLYEKIVKDDSNNTYLTEWVYPGRNRPFITRSGNLDLLAPPVTGTKHFKPLQHHFFMMPPILKPNGALLGQRCSFVLEQSFEVTFHFPQALFDYDVNPLEDALNFGNQDNAVMLRRNFYPHRGKESTENSYFCGKNAAMSCTGEMCPADSLLGFARFMNSTINQDAFDETYELEAVDPGSAMIHIKAGNGYFTDADINANLPTWLDMIKTGSSLVFVCEGGKIVGEPDNKMWQVGELSADGTDTRTYDRPYRGPGTSQYIYLIFSGKAFQKVFREHGITCSTYYSEPLTRQRAAEVYDRTCRVFHV
uniref:VP1 n=1 Tax=Tarsiger cyanurus densovirus TaxID=2794546 RepID=A0A8A4XDP6_9VIRU|nr:MAG: VP1 [Tarsiger cyanurus densovirus]